MSATTNNSKLDLSLSPEQRVQAFNQNLIERLGRQSMQASSNLEWLSKNMPGYFFITMNEELRATTNLVMSLNQIASSNQVTLLDEPGKLVVSKLDRPGSIYETLKAMRHRPISYAEMNHSFANAPGSDFPLEVLKFEFDLLSPGQVIKGKGARVPKEIKARVAEAMNKYYPDFDCGELDRLLKLVWINNQDYVCISPSERLARLLWLFQKCRQHDGLYVDVEETDGGEDKNEARVVFAVGNPPDRGFLAQAMEVFNRLDIGIRRSYSISVSTEVHPYFLSNFYVIKRDGTPVVKDSELFRQLKTELYNTQILSPSTEAYTDLVDSKVMSGQAASLTNTFISFCHTTLSHNQPDRFDLETVKHAFLAHPGITAGLVELFRLRFEPGLENRDELFEAEYETMEAKLASYNTGHRHLDLVRRTIYRACLLFIKHTLKTNFYVPEKHALAFRMDPAYLTELGTEFTEDLPDAMPFRVTFFFGRHGAGYHIGFSDIARGGWRTIICRSEDEYLSNNSTLFREVFVLAHTQHLKNKDIYEGGSKLTVILDAMDMEDDQGDELTQRLYKLQYGFTNAFLDIFVTEDGKVTSPYVVDYYGEDEPIEIGPDENMHDAMIELIAKQSEKRGFVLGMGIMSSKAVGINHKEYGVTSRGVIRFAEIVMGHTGVDMHKDDFSIKITGGPYGDVAGNSMRLILERCPGARILSIVDGTGGVYDPEGINKKALGDIVLKSDLDAFDPTALNEGGYILYRNQKKQDNMRELFKMITKNSGECKESWVTADELNNKLDYLVFKVETDLFLPCGGRPETINGANWDAFLNEEERPTSPVIVEGANSFITPEAREELQNKGVVLMRDASANKCGVISSSYEIIANLLMSRKEFMSNKDAYVADVLRILDRRAADEAKLILKRYEDNEGRLLYTDISSNMSNEINQYYADLFNFFSTRPDLPSRAIYKNVILSHLPRFVREHPKYRARIKNLPPKIAYAIMASEIATFIVYKGGWDTDLEARLESYLRPRFSRQSAK